MRLTIRPLAAGDETAWRRLWSGYLDFYRTTLPAETTDAVFKRLSAGAPHFAFVAVSGGAIVGFVHALPHPSTWSLDGYCYLEDLYVDPTVRGTGAGRALIEAVYAEADARGLSRVYWNTENGNETARQLYDRLAKLSDFVQYRREALVRDE